MAPDDNIHCPRPSTKQDTKQQTRPETKSSVFKSLLHRRPDPHDIAVTTEPAKEHQQYPSPGNDMGAGHFAKNNPGALGELQHNQQESAPRSPRKPKDNFENDHSRSRSPAKTALGLKLTSDKPSSRMTKSRDPSPKKVKESRSGTGLAGLLSRPKSLRNMYKLAMDDEGRFSKDKENRTPDESPGMTSPPIFAQFTSDASVRSPQNDNGTGASSNDNDYFTRTGTKERPKSYQVGAGTQHVLPTPPSPTKYASFASNFRQGLAGDKEKSTTQRSRPFSAFTHGRSKSTASTPASGSIEQVLDPKDIDKHLEALLDRRNIPENQRYKMRNLNDTIKMEFIRQDWAEMQTAKSGRPGTNDSVNSADTRASRTSGSDGEDDKQKRGRGRSFTFTRGRKDSSSSPTKKHRGEGTTLGRHFRGKSTDSVNVERPPSSSGPSAGSNLLSKIKLHQGPGDYVAYLRKVQKPELVEVGKLHKLRLLLRNETVAWIEDFIQQGGLMEIAGLLTRIMEVEWREEHEDALLHENLLCLKALSSTARAMEYLHSVQADLFPKLLHMLFDPERKGPSEFTTRNIITSILLTYIESATPAERVLRAKTVLLHLRDPEPKDDERPLPFVLEMRQDRPYRQWCKEVVSVTKEVFWIFLHNLNVVALPSDKSTKSSELVPPPQPGNHGPYSYMLRNFPLERPPVPAAPYVGGVEWDATNYLASHLDLMNAILSCTATPDARNALRAELRISGWERCMGGSLRLCKEKFYGSVHVGLRTWVAAAAEDHWDVKDVRFGPPPESRASPKKQGGQKKKVEEPPKLDMLKLDLGLEQSQAAPQVDAWL